MLKFRSLGDGDCLYNSEAVSLIQAFLQGKLNKLFKNPVLLAQYHRLLKTFEEQELVEVADEITEGSVKAGFNALITAFTEDNQIQWIGLQQHLSIGLRNFVTEAIKTDPVTKQFVKAELIQTINQCIDMAYVDGVLVDDIEIEGINGSHFHDMEVIEAKIAEILMDDTLSTADQKKVALRRWFFEGEETGFTEYLEGENGIANVAVHAGEVEIKVLSHKLGIVHKTCPSGAENVKKAATYYNGFRSAEDSKKLAKNALVFSFEKTPIHWNCLLPETVANRKMVELYNDQRDKQEKADAIDAILEKYDSFASHHADQQSELSIKEYCKLYGLTQKQYDNSSSLKNTLEEITPSSAKNDETKNHSQEDNDIQLSNFAKYFILSAAVIAIFAHCLVMPLLIPMLNSLLIGTTITANLQILSLALTAALSGTGAYWLAEKLETPNAVSHLVTPLKNTEKSVEANKETINLVDKPETVLVYHNTNAQERRTAEIAKEQQEQQEKPTRRSRAKAH